MPQSERTGRMLYVNHTEDGLVGEQKYAQTLASAAKQVIAARR